MSDAWKPTLALNYVRCLLTNFVLIYPYISLEASRQLRYQIFSRNFPFLKMNNQSYLFAISNKNNNQNKDINTVMLTYSANYFLNQRRLQFYALQRVQLFEIVQTCSLTLLTHQLLPHPVECVVCLVVNVFIILQSQRVCLSVWHTKRVYFQHFYCFEKHSMLQLPLYPSPLN